MDDTNEADRARATTLMPPITLADFKYAWEKAQKEMKKMETK